MSGTTHQGAAVRAWLSYSGPPQPDQEVVNRT